MCIFHFSILWFPSYFELVNFTDNFVCGISMVQICWIWQKVSSEDDRGFQRFLDTVQYKCSGILRYERVFGQGFVSTGGIGISQ